MRSLCSLRLHPLQYVAMNAFSEAVRGALLALRPGLLVARRCSGRARSRSQLDEMQIKMPASKSAGTFTMCVVRSTKSNGLIRRSPEFMPLDRSKTSTGIVRLIHDEG